jgi:hypothetical protein
LTSGFLAFSRKFLGFLAPLIAAVGLSFLLLAGIYRQPHAGMRGVDSWGGFATGLHGIEKTQWMSYVYTNGDAALQLPEIGAGRYLVEMRMGGPSGGFSTKAHLGIETRQVDLGVLAPVRLYHLLAPVGSGGNLRLAVQSTTIQPPDDPRQLGVLLERVGVRSLGPATPPAALLLAVPAVLLLLWMAIRQLGASMPWKTLLLAILSVTLCGTYALFRGRVAMQPWWIGIGLSAIAGMSLSRADNWESARSLRGVALAFALWRLALWLIAIAGLWYSDVIYRYGRGIAFSFGKTIFGHGEFIWRALAQSWMQWDAEHYQNIALYGYTFQNVRWPNIAFFPLYPLLIRLLLPITGNNVTIAALLVSNLALFAAVLLLYDLLARDFDRKVAYRTVLLLLLFPTSFYFVAGYTESLALALTVAALWAMRRERWWLAGTAGFFLALTRVPGVMIAPVLAVAYLQRRNWRWRSIRPDFLAIILPPLGLGLFMLYQWQRFDTPFAFLIAQQNWNNGSAPPWVIPEKIWRGVRFSQEWEMATFQLCVWASFIGLMALAFLRLPLPYALTALLLLLPAYMANQRGSLVRHVLIAFPAFVALALVTQRLWLRWLIISTALPLLVVLTLLFVNGFGLA